MPVVGTAGHVDHGKSTLIQALTGRDPDRWEEEKQRGLTIDLGFAWTSLPDGTDVSFVDVPGHQRFIKNMLAGIEAVDVALLVVAADEGWMPQSEEHLAVLDLLEVRHGVVAVTKTDRVDDDLLELVMLDITDQLRGTSLEGSAIVPVSATEGTGIDRLTDELARQVAGAVASFRDPGRPRLWIDRAFTIAGSGTVITGTLLDGPLAVDDRLMVWPGEAEARVRGLQSHERSLERVEPHRRVAANLVGVDKRDVPRGSMLGVPNAWMPTDRILADVRPARYVDEIGPKGAYHLHIGSGAYPVRLQPLGDGGAILRLDRPLPLAVGDRFVLREVGRRAVVGGGRVLDPAPSRRERWQQLRAVVDASPDEQATALLRLRGRDDVARLAAHTRGGVPGEGIGDGTLVVADRLVPDLQARLRDVVAGYHERFPLRDGIPKATAAEALGLPAGVVEAVAAGTEVVDRGAVLALASFSTAVDEDAASAVVHTLEAAGLTVPRVRELDAGDELIHALVRSGRLTRVSEDFVYTSSQIERLVEAVRAMEAPFTVSEFRERFGISRKYAVPLLEWLDRTGVTVRRGDHRTVR